MPKYDLAVVGAGLGGLAAAALMSSSGKKVIVSESGASLDAALGVREFDGFRFFHGPTLSYGFEAGGIFREIFAKLGHAQEGLKHARRFQVALPNRRITVSANQEETHEELRREFPREVLSIEKFYRDIKEEAAHIVKSRIAAYFAKRKSAARFIARYHFSSEFTIFLDIQSRYFFDRPLSQLSVAKLITLCETMPARFPGGTKELADQLLAVLRKSGGDITFGETPSEIAFKNGRPIGIKTERLMIESNTILLDAPQHQPPTYFLGILDDVVPVGMAQDVLYLPNYARPDEFLAISVSGEDDVALAPMNARALTVSLRSSNGPEHVQDDLIGPLSAIVPFLNENVFFIEPSQRVAPSFRLTEDVTFKPVRSADKRPLLMKTSKRNLYMLQDAPSMPLELMTAVHIFVAKIA